VARIQELEVKALAGPRLDAWTENQLTLAKATVNDPTGTVEVSEVRATGISF
jgi:hypothetical protein